MTDNEIVKGLECCTKNNVCNECPLGCGDIENCIEFLAESALDLINRYRNLINCQKAEIERLKYYNENLSAANVDLSCGLLDEIKRAKAEAIKEFAERLKEYPIECRIPLLGLETKEEIETYVNSVMKQVDNAINNLVKEMTEEAT